MNVCLILISHDGINLLGHGEYIDPLIQDLPKFFFVNRVLSHDEEYLYLHYCVLSEMGNDGGVRIGVSPVGALGSGIISMCPYMRE